MKFSERNKDILKRGGVGVLPTDTIYGVVGSAMNKNTVERIYSLRYRDKGKPMIVLISSLDDFRLFGIKLDSEEKDALNKLWPGKVSVVLPCSNPELEYLHRGTGSIAFRVPDYDELRKLIMHIGPLVAPSANPEGRESATTIRMAEEYFGSDMDFYEDSGKLDGEPSTLVIIRDGKFFVLREGAVKIDDALGSF